MRSKKNFAGEHKYAFIKTLNYVKMKCNLNVQ